MFDIYDDQGKLLKDHFPNANELPDFVRQGLRQFKFGEKLASVEFALSVPTGGGMKNIYPIANDALTAVSCFYFEHTHQGLPANLQKAAAIKLSEACERFGVQTTEKVAELSTDYQVPAASATPALKKPFQEQGVEGSSLFPLSTPEQVKVASDLFDRVVQKLHPEERRQFSQNLIRKTAELNLPAPRQAFRWGGNNLSKLAAIDALEKRAQFMTEDQLRLLRKASDTIINMHPDKVAELLYSLDEELGLESMWGKNVPDPRAIYEQLDTPGTVKVAGLEMPTELWHDACDKGLLDVFEDGVKQSLREHPDLIDRYGDGPVKAHILGTLESMGYLAQ